MYLHIDKQLPKVHAQPFVTEVAYMYKTAEVKPVWAPLGFINDGGLKELRKTLCVYLVYKTVM